MTTPRRGRAPGASKKNLIKENIFKNKKQPNTVSLGEETPQPKENMPKEEVIEAPVMEGKDFVSDDFSPLADPVIERSYNETTVIDEIGDIPEPVFHSGSPVFDDESEDEIVEETAGGPSLDNVTNPAMSEMDKKDQAMAATQLVNVVLDAYEMLHTIGVKAASISEESLYEKIVSGEIDPEIRVPMGDEGEEVNAIEYAQIHNEQAKSAFAYDPSFGDKVRPAMVRVFTKRGWGMSDEQYIAAEFAKDLGLKAISVYAFKKQGQQISKHFMTATLQHKEQMASRVVHQASTIEKPNHTKQAPIIEPDPDPVTVEDIENEINSKE